MSRPALRCSSVLGLVAVVTWGRVARSEPAPGETSPRTLIENCPDELAGRLPALTKLEIDVLLREHGPSPSSPDSITYRCQDDVAHIDVAMGGSTRSSI